jgi:adenylate cyclase
VLEISNLILILLLYVNVKVIKKYLRSNNLLFLFLSGILLFTFFNYWLSVHSIILGNFLNHFQIIMNILPILIFIVIIVLESLRKKEEKEKIKTKNYFSKYLSEKIVDNLLEGKLELGGKKEEVSIIFTDIRGFTSLSEKLDAQQIVELLNGHFDIITHEIFEEEGTVLKYIGDATMAIFNAPIKHENHVEKTINACIKIQKRMKIYADLVQQKYKIENFSIGIGVNVGEVVIGNIGSHKYMDYTIIGDSVNTASRLNGQADAGEIVVSEKIYLEIKNKFKFTKPKSVKVKGKEKEVKIYKVIYE